VAPDEEHGVAGEKRGEKQILVGFLPAVDSETGEEHVGTSFHSSEPGVSVAQAGSKPLAHLCCAAMLHGQQSPVRYAFRELGTVNRLTSPALLGWVKAARVAVLAYVVALAFFHWLLWAFPLHLMAVAFLLWHNLQLRRAKKEASAEEPGKSHLSIPAAGAIAASILVLVATIPLALWPFDARNAGPIHSGVIALIWWANHAYRVLGGVPWLCPAILLAASVDLLRPTVSKKLPLVALAASVLMSGFALTAYARNYKFVQMAPALKEYETEVRRREETVYEGLLELASRYAISVDDVPKAASDLAENRLGDLRKVWEFPDAAEEIGPRPIFGPFVHGPRLAIAMGGRHSMDIHILDRATGRALRQVEVVRSGASTKSLCVQQADCLYAGGFGAKTIAMDLDDLSVRPLSPEEWENLWRAEEVLPGAYGTLAHVTFGTVDSPFLDALPAELKTDRNVLELLGRNTRVRIHGVFPENIYVSMGAVKQVPTPEVENSFYTEKHAVVLAALEQDTGSLKWRMGLRRGPGESSVYVRVSGEFDGVTFVHTGEKVLAVDSATGRPLWQAGEGRAIGASEGHVFLLDGWERGKTISMRNVRTGSLAGRLTLDRNVSIGPLYYRSRFSFAVSPDEVILFVKSEGKDRLVCYRR
jgi:hypothetical protein